MDIRQTYFMNSVATKVSLLLSFSLTTKTKFLEVILKTHGLKKAMAPILEAAFYFLLKMITPLN